MNHTTFPSRVKRLSDGSLEKPFFSRSLIQLQLIMQRQEIDGWKLKGDVFINGDYWCCIMRMEGKKVEPNH